MLTFSELHRKYYRWWTFRARFSGRDVVVKLGPLTVAVYQWDGWHIAVTWLGQEPLFDTGLRAHRKKPELRNP